MDSNLSYFPVNPAQNHIFTVQEVLDNLGESMVQKFLIIGIIALACGLWHMFKDPNKNNETTVFITGLVNMACIVAGITGIVFYVVYKFKLVNI